MRVGYKIMISIHTENAGNDFMTDTHILTKERHKSIVNRLIKRRPPALRTSAICDVSMGAV